MPSHNLFCKPLKGGGVGVGNCPSAHSPRHLVMGVGRGAGVAFSPTVRQVPLERNPDQTRQVNRQLSARHRINRHDFIVSLGIKPQPSKGWVSVPLYSGGRGSSVLWT